ncbi:transmembrane protein 150A-like [Petromyzon marinus]|uniref:Transmembrane protein 150A-like n=1 Tax=Petromyzon marinus TaxID=7757 RepID=A0AAJ7TBX9_PETMA|nr:transmembrane protein 150A-like [Petromyzon marinus]
MALWCCLPLAFGVISTAGVWTVYGLAVQYGHVCAFSQWSRFIEDCYNETDCCDHDKIPYISATGATRPESALFSIVTTISSIVLALVALLLHGLTVQACGSSRLEHMSRAALACTCLAAVGAFLVGSCPSAGEALRWAHLISAAICMAAGTVAAGLQTLVSWKLQGGVASWVQPWVAGMRAALCLFLLLTGGLYGFLYVRKEARLLRVAAVCEWAAFSVFCLVFATFALELYGATRATLSALTCKRADSDGMQEHILFGQMSPPN